MDDKIIQRWAPLLQALATGDGGHMTACTLTRDDVTALERAITDDEAERERLRADCEMYRRRSERLAGELAEVLDADMLWHCNQALQEEIARLHRENGELRSERDAARRMAGEQWRRTITAECKISPVLIWAPEVLNNIWHTL